MKIGFKTIFYWVCLSAILLVSTTFFAQLKNNYDPLHFGDTAQYYAILQNIHEGNGPKNPFLPTLIDFAFIKKLPIVESSTLCTSDFHTLPYLAEDYNHFKFHYYAVLYPISLILNHFSSEEAVNWVNVFAFISFLIIAFLIVKKNTENTFFSLFLITSIAFHPAWSWSIMGQPYVDRLYLPLGLLIAYLIEIQKKPIGLVYIPAILSSLIVEKVFIINSLFIATYASINFKNNKIFYYRILYSIISFIIFILLIKFYVNNIYYSTTIVKSWAEIANLINNKNFINGAISFIEINFFFLLPALIVDKKLFLLGLIIMLPNIIGNIGGAEKIGFYTHYHSLYFPYLAYIYIKSSSIIFNILKKYAFIILIYISLVIIFFCNISFNGNSKIQFNEHSSNFVTYFYNLYAEKTDNSRVKNLVNQTIPLGSKISSVEQGMPYLYNHSQIDIFPLNISTSDYLIVGYNYTNDKYYFYGYSGYLGMEHDKKVNDCLNLKIQELKFDIDNPIKIRGNLAILKKK